MNPDPKTPEERPDVRAVDKAAKLNPADRAKIAATLTRATRRPKK